MLIHRISAKALLLFLGTFLLAQAGMAEDQWPMLIDGLIEHRSPYVSKPTILAGQLGGTPGVIAGLPLSIPWMIVAEPFCPKGLSVVQQYEYAFAPAYGTGWVCANICGGAVGAPCWLLFGWWLPGGGPFSHQWHRPGDRS